MANFLDSLGMGGEIDVYVTVSPSCGMEMTTLDAHGNINTYAQIPLDYNETQREILSYDAFKDGLEQLFDSRNINPKKAKVHLSLPSVWFGLKEGIQLLLDDDAITNIVLGELEQTYIFKRKDPRPSWFEALASTNSDSRSVFYTALQEDVIERLTTIVEDLGATLVSIGNEIIADLKGLLVTGIASEQMNDDSASWSLMIINNSGFQLIGLRGKSMVEYYEEPLPIKSYEGEEIYSAIENAAQIAFMNSASSSLVIVSETNLVSAEILAKNLQFGGQKIFVEDNKYRKSPLIEMSLNVIPEDQIKVSLHTLGSIVSDSVLPISVDFLSSGNQKAVVDNVIEIPLGNDKFYRLTPPVATVAAIALAIVLAIPMVTGSLIVSSLSKSATEKVSELDNQITEVDEQLKKYDKSKDATQFDPVAEIEKVLKNNRTKIMAYAALGESIPKNLYLTYFMTGNDGYIDVKGCADSVEDVYVFFRNLKDSLAGSNLRLSKLDLKTNSLDTVVNSTMSTIDNAPYVFEITNMSDDQLTSFMNKLMGKEDKPAAPAASPNPAPQPAPTAPVSDESIDDEEG
ncbi:hypothetical protein IJ579_05120 [bacterium]|nr:hypothetical protein [bacterium]